MQFSTALQDAIAPLIEADDYGSVDQLMLVIVAVYATHEENLEFSKGHNALGTYTDMISQKKLRYCTLGIPFGSDEIVNTPEGTLRRRLIRAISQVMRAPEVEIPQTFDYARLSQRLQPLLDNFANASLHKHHVATERFALRPTTFDDSARLLAYHQQNREHLQPWSPARAAAFYTLEAMRELLDQQDHDMETDTAVHLVIQFPDSEEFLGLCSFTNIVRGPFQACHLGFSLAASHQGKGYMHEALEAAIRHMFDAGHLHRIMANYQPHNQRSEQLLQRLGFEREGLAKKYLQINGEWKDHVLTALIND